MKDKKRTLIVKTDSYDGYYATEESEISEESLVKFRGLLSKITPLPIPYKGFEWGIGEVKGKDNDPRIIYKDKLTEEEIEWLEAYFPYGEYGIHSICSITLVEILEKL